MDNPYKKIFSRNIGILTESEQDKLRDSTIAIAGAGGVGGLLAERLVRLGVGHLKIIDPEAFEESNLNRQFSSSMLNLGKNKAEAVFMQIKDINPEANIYYNKSSIKTENDAHLLVQDCDLVIDEMDFGLFKESILLQRAARQRGVYYIFTSAIGFGALIAIFDPEGCTLEEYNKLPRDIDLNDVDQLTVPLDRICPVIPSYFTSDIMQEQEMVDVMQEILSGKRPGPTISIGVGLASILAANEAVNIILRRRDIATAPKYTYIDLLDRTFIVGTMS
jgi:molybdopterin/thiamine biosynthesis adenylyltransferase